jgi:Tol biopolymer transport system component
MRAAVAQAADLLKKYHHLFMVLSLALSGCSIGVGRTTGANPPPQTVPPADWHSLNLSGRLVYGTSSLQGGAAPFSIQVLDLKTGESKTIFEAPDHSWIYYTAVSPDGRQVIISYVPPSESNSASNEALYILPSDGSAQPRELIPPPTESDRYPQVEWSPDGKYVYFVHTNSINQTANQILPNYEIYRMAYPDGIPEKVVDHAFWPRLSPDSSKLAYISLDPYTVENALFVANADGGNSRKIILAGPMAMMPTILDAPIFLPDGQTILFSGPSPVQSYQPDWFEKVAGIQIAHAHNVPSDWWSVPVEGGTPTRLTHIQTTGLFASISPDQQHIASMSGEGIFVMDLDGTNLIRVLPDLGVFGTVRWIP